MTMTFTDDFSSHEDVEEGDSSFALLFGGSASRKLSKTSSNISKSSFKNSLSKALN